MKKKSHSIKNVNLNRIILLALVLVNAFWIVFLYQKINQQSNQASNIDLITRTQRSLVDSLNNPPTDFRTGDIYFPEMNLKIPKNDRTNMIMYGYTDDISPKINITAKNILSLSKVSPDSNLNDILAEISYLQSCSRGITVSADSTYSTFDNLEVSEKILSNGKRLYLSYEKQCDNLLYILDTVKTINSY